jgi:Family of unknown function (DUF5681)
MSHMKARRSAKRRSKKTPTNDYKVGFCNPPRAHQFKPGNNANPMGRPKGTRNRKVLVRELLLEPIAAREGNAVKKMSKLEAIVTQTINDGLKGDHKSRLLAIGMAREAGLLTPEQVDAIEENSPQYGSIAERLAAALARVDGEQDAKERPPRSQDARKPARKVKRPGTR